MSQSKPLSLLRRDTSTKRKRSNVYQSERLYSQHGSCYARYLAQSRRRLAQRTRNLIIYSATTTINHSLTLKEDEEVKNSGLSWKSNVIPRQAYNQACATKAFNGVLGVSACVGQRRTVLKNDRLHFYLLVEKGNPASCRLGEFF